MIATDEYNWEYWGKYFVCYSNRSCNYKWLKTLGMHLLLLRVNIPKLLDIQVVCGWAGVVMAPSNITQLLEFRTQKRFTVFS